LYNSSSTLKSTTNILRYCIISMLSSKEKMMTNRVTGR
jgi:hypothetical protein